MQLPAANVALCLYNCTGLDLVVLQLSSKRSGCTPAGTSAPVLPAVNLRAIVFTLLRLQHYHRALRILL